MKKCKKKIITVNKSNRKVLPNRHFNLSPRFEGAIEKSVVDSVANRSWNLVTAIKKMLTTLCGILIGIVYAAIDALDHHFILIYIQEERVKMST